MNKVNIYLALNNYDGISNHFYLETKTHKQIPLTIVDDIIVEGYHKYECTFMGDLLFGQEYLVYHQYGRYTPLVFAAVTKSDAFDKLFYYDKKDLGFVYQPQQTTFKLWAPTAYKVSLDLKHNGKSQMLEMQRQSHGVYEVSVKQDILGASYVFYVEVNGEVNVCLDPYGKANTINSQRSVVVDLSQITKKQYDLPVMNSYCDAIIYEASIRDYSEKGRIVDFIQEKTGSALNYIARLKITHLQLLPMMDFKSVDDEDIKHYYNWGYDPYQWMAFENSYSSDVHNPMQILKDVKQLVDAAHEKGVRVTFDVVFNHVYEINDSSLQLSVPYYYFQYNENDGYSNATMCGNDVDSKRLMCRKLIVESCEYLTDVFQIDGLRFDLMGILDVDTMNEVVTRCQAINKDFIVYGEGWHMPSFLEDHLRASIPNNEQMEKIAHFSDRFRDCVKGSTSVDQINDLGYMLGDTSKVYRTMNVLGGSVQDVGDTRLFRNADQSVNYVECHDNMTSWDKVDAAKKCSRRLKREHHKMMIATVLFAQGIPFLHGGQEFCRTKHGLANTYNAPDSINKIDYSRMRRYKDIVEYTKEVITIRQQNSCLRQNKASDIFKNVSYELIEDKMLRYNVQDENGALIILFNPSYDAIHFPIEEGYEMIFYNALLEMPETPETIDVHGVSVVVLKKQATI